MYFHFPSLANLNVPGINSSWAGNGKGYKPIWLESEKIWSMLSGRFSIAFFMDFAFSTKGTYSDHNQLYINIKSS